MMINDTSISHTVNHVSVSTPTQEWKMVCGVTNTVGVKLSVLAVPHPQFDTLPIIL